DLASGAYLMRLSAEGHADDLPFYVRPPRGGPRADVLYIASTYTYQAYANHARGSTDAAYRERVAAWGASPTPRTATRTTAGPPTTGTGTVAASATPRG